ncbi:response regulator [Falsirhodobacter sp. 1013]|uniref:response regulator n=1 Tax=Falsirhodobacter sp. 1013 TaxID=3417566 RepID=UPI003EC14BA9
MCHHILIVEDTTLLALDLAATFEDAGLTVVGIAKDMKSALRLAEAHTIDLATMDIELAHGSCGVTTAQELWGGHGVPSLFVSGSITDEVQEAAAVSNPVGFILKPAEPDTVLAAITSFFDDGETKQPA